MSGALSHRGNRGPLPDQTHRASVLSDSFTKPLARSDSPPRSDWASSRKEVRRLIYGCLKRRDELGAILVILSLPEKCRAWANRYFRHLHQHKVWLPRAVTRCRLKKKHNAGGVHQLAGNHPAGHHRAAGIFKDNA